MPCIPFTVIVSIGPASPSVCATSSLTKVLSAALSNRQFTVIRFPSVPCAIARIVWKRILIGPRVLVSRTLALASVFSSRRDFFCVGCFSLSGSACLRLC
ncbi:hypothetical protein T01_8712 [Trichinella spiralis]|uniref:Uncharacterized protein n=1 Tax=Trichinella spiralis TaxID=6334 RepID=A0A0V1AQ41_TRISP|nr:hypothetical protein T01_8712 [Trichinella spiralis]